MTENVKARAKKHKVVNTNTSERLPKKQTLRNNEYYDLQEVYDKLYESSVKDTVFTNLMDIIMDEDNIRLAFRNIKTNTGSKTCGTDGLTIKDIMSLDSEKYVNSTVNALKDYHPDSVRRVTIPKGNGKRRPLGIPTMRDRLIQQSIKQVLEPICEAKFHPRSYAFRPNRNTHQAVAKLYQMIQRQNLHYVVDVDIKGFFDNVNHGKLLKQLWSLGIRDKNLLMVISKMLKAPIEGEGIPEKGTPQGGILSPLLSNIVLNELDWWIDSQWENMKTKHNYKTFRKGSVDCSNHYRALRNTKLKEIYILRYADDFKILCRNHKDAEKIFKAVKLWLKDRLDLQTSSEKSKITNVRKGHTEFLGFKITVKKKKNKFVVQSSMTDKAKKNAIKKIKEKIELIQKSKPNQIASSVAGYNSTILGLHNYYCVATNVALDFSNIDFLIRRTFYTRLKYVITQKGEKPRIYDKFYKGYKNVRYISNIGTFPIYGVKTRPPQNFRLGVNNYTKEGRKMVHNNLTAVDTKIISYMLENFIPNRSIQYNDNRISRYVGQNGKCGVSGATLEIGNMECHHQIPLSQGGNDDYDNLIFVTSEVHKLIHAIEMSTIQEYLDKLNLEPSQVKKLDTLRGKIGNCKIEKLSVKTVKNSTELETIS